MIPTFEVWPGPMEGVSRPEFVYAVNQLKLVKRWMTPFLRVSDTCFKEKKIKEFLAPYLASSLEVTAQIMGTNPRILAELAARCLACGAAGINLNCGCPSKRVVSGGAGGGALKDPDKLCRIVREIRAAAGEKIRFSVKMRSGYKAPEEMLSLIPRLADAGTDAFFIHYRTVTEQYLPVSGRTERLRQAVRAAAGLPVVVNGDIASVEEGKCLVEETQASGVMIARAFMRDPFLLERFEDPDAPCGETGRQLFFKTLESHRVSGGNRLELAKMIFGAQSTEFRRMLTSEFISK